MRVGRTYWMINPNDNTADFITMRRLILPRVEVTLRRVRWWSIKRRYEVEYMGKLFRTGRLEKEMSKRAIQIPNPRHPR